MPFKRHTRGGHHYGGHNAPSRFNYVASLLKTTGYNQGPECSLSMLEENEKSNKC